MISYFTRFRGNGVRPLLCDVYVGKNVIYIYKCENNILLLFKITVINGHVSWTVLNEP